MHCENFKKIQDRKGKSNNNAYQRRKKKVVLPLIPEKEDNFSVWKNGKNALNTIINLNDFPVLDCYKNHKSKLKKECCKITPSQNIDLPHTNTNDRNIQNQALPTLPSQISEENHVSDEQGYEIVQESLETLIQNVSAITEKTENEYFYSNTGDSKDLREITQKNCDVSKKTFKNYKKKRAEPVIVGLGEALDANKAQLKIKSTKGEKGKFQKHFDNEFLSGNTLDSSNPTRTRGKQREVKKPKLTNLKKCIIKERILKEKFKEKSLGSFCTEEVNDLINNTDFKTEMKEYIHKLEKNKIPKANKKASKETEIEKKTLEKENNKLNAEAPDIVKETAEKLASHFSPEVTTFVPKKAHFSSKMREYCDNIVTPALNAAVTEMIKELADLQDRAFSKNPIKSKARKRHVSGMKEVKKYLVMNKVKMVIISPDLEKLRMQGSVDDWVNELKSLAKSQNVPCVFALNRFRLGRSARKNVPTSAFAVLNHDGIEDQFMKVLQHLEEAKNQLAEMMENLKVKGHEGEEEDVNAPLTASLMSAFREVLALSKPNTENDHLEINDE